MFDQLNFWAHWPKKQKYSVVVLLILLSVTLLYLLISYYSGSAFVIDWEVKTISNPVRILYDKFYSGLYEFSIFADNYLITKTFQPGALHMNTLTSYVFLVAFFLLVLFLYVIATTLSRFYFVLASVFFTGVLITYRFENLLLFGFYGKEAFVGVLLLYFAPAYYFHAFRSDASLFIRYIILLCITTTIGLTIAIFAQVDEPFLYLVSYQVVSPLIISVIFIIMLGFEVVKGFLLAITSYGEGDGKNNFIHFTIITLFYLLVLVFIFLYRQNYISFKLIFIDAVWILLAAILFGLWGFKNKEEVYAYLFSFRPVGVYVYLTLAIICASSFAYFFVSANDPYIEILEQAVLISQMSFGLLFFVYVLANFFPVMMEGHSVDKILYKPKFLPYFSAKLASVVGMVALFFLIKMAPYFQAYSGYYISLAQLFRHQQNELMAEEYFKLSNIYGKQTHMGNYALAQIEGEKGNILEKEKYLANSINVNPTEFAFAQFADMYHRRNKYFDEIFILKNGVNEFPDSGPLSNNLGLALSKTNIIDTSLFYLEKAYKKSISKEAAQANIMSIYGKHQIAIGSDSLKRLYGSTDDLSVLNNLIVIANFNNWKLPIGMDLNFEPGININNLIYNFNFLFEYPEKADSTTWKALRHFYNIAEMSSFEEELDYSFALASAKTNHSIAAFRILNSLSYEDNFGYSKYHALLAQLYLHYDAPQLAVDYFNKTARFYSTEMQIQHAIALLEIHDLDKAHEILKSIAVSGERIPQIIAELLTVIEIETIDEVLNHDDDLKYNYLKYRGLELSDIQHEGIIISMEDEGYQYAAYVDYLSRMLRKNNYQEFSNVVKKIPLKDIESPHIRRRYLKLLGEYYSGKGDYKEITDLLAVVKNENLNQYYNMLLAKSFEQVDDFANAEKIYSELSSFDAFCEPCILHSARYFAEHKSDKLKEYNILLAALEINPYSYSLNKAYIKSAIEMGLHSYAEDVLTRMSEYMDPEKYIQLENFAEKLKQENDTEW